MRRTLTILLFGLLSTLVMAQSPTFDTVYLYRGGEIYYYHTSGDTVFINADTILGSGDIIQPVYDSVDNVFKAVDATNISSVKFTRLDDTYLYESFGHLHSEYALETSILDPTTITGLGTNLSVLEPTDNNYTIRMTESDSSKTNELQALSYSNRVMTIGAGGGTPNGILVPRFSQTDTASGLVKGNAALGATYFLNATNAWAVPPDLNTTYTADETTLHLTTTTFSNITKDSTYIRAGTNITVDSSGNTYTINAVARITPLFGVAVDSSLINTTIKFPIGYSNGIVIDTLVFITTTIGAGTDTITPKIYYGTDIEAAGTAVVTSPAAVTSHTTVTKVSTFNQATIAAGNMIWLRFSVVTRKPRNFMVQIIGHQL